MTKHANRIWGKAKDPKIRNMVKDIKGKTLNQLEQEGGKDQHLRQAVWIRLHNEAHGSKHYREVNPDGSLGDFKKFTEGKKKGQNKIATRKATSGIVNAVKAMHAHRDANKISAAMGGRHKVRPFYNNILDPNSKNRDVTVDTHAIGASWLSPHTASHVSVVHSLGLPINKKKLPAGAMTTKNSASTGISGAYPIYADAYREAAEHLSKEHNIELHARQLQSIAWEAKRRMFGEKTTGKKVKAAVSEIWDKHHNGELSHEEAQHAVVHAAMKSLGRKTSGRKISGESLDFIRDLVEEILEMSDEYSHDHDDDHYHHDYEDHEDHEDHDEDDEDEDAIIAHMKKHGIPITRRNYIDINRGAGRKKLTPEEEDELPVHLQDPD
jgi:hypothetical protein